MRKRNKGIWLTTTVANCLMLLSLSLSAACKGGGSTDRPTLSVSIEPQRQLLEQIVGDNYDVVSLLPKGANPENYDPTMRQRMDADRSQIYFTTGLMPFEQAIMRTLSPQTRVVDTSAAIDLITGTHSHAGHDHADHDADHHSHSDADPHIWTSVRNARQMASTMAQAVIELDPDNAALYRQRLQALCQSLDSLDQAIADRLAAKDVHAFMVWHPSLSYFARDYGLRQLSVGYEAKEQSLSNLRDVIAQARADSIKVFFFQKEYDSRQAQALNKAVGSTIITINPLAFDWQQELTNITDALTR